MSHTWLFNLKKKSDTIIHAWQFVAYAKNQHNASIGTWRFDGGTEFLNDAFKTMLLWNSLLSLILSYQPCLSYLIKWTIQLFSLDGIEQLFI